MIYTSLNEKPLYVFLNIQSVYFLPERQLVDNIEILDEEIVYQSGSFTRIKRWLRGVHPKLGTIVRGITGWETLVEKDVIKPANTFYVHEKSDDTDQTILRRTDSQCTEQTIPQDGDAISINQGSPATFAQAS